MQRTLGERATFVAAAIGVIAGLLFLFAPIHGYCMSGASAIATPIPPGATPGPPVVATPGPTVCGTDALWQRQTIFPMPFFAVLVWSFAPTLAHVGARRRAHGHEGSGTLLLVLGLILAFTSIISFGAAYFFVPFVALPTLIASLIAVARRPMG